MIPELEVGQVWETMIGGKPFLRKIIWLDEDIVIVLESNNNFNSWRVDSYHAPGFHKHNTLITTADGKPYVKPNDYRPGDVWEGAFGGNSLEYFIYRTSVLRYICSEGASGPVCNNFINNPQDYTLKHRDGKQVIGGKAVSND